MARALSLTVVAGLASPLQAAQPSFPIGIVQSLASVATQASGTSYVLIRTGSQRSAQAGMELVYNYGAVQLWKASGSALMKLAATSDALVQKTTLDVPSGEFDPLVSGRKDTGGSFGPQVYLVQFVGPAPDEWLDQVRATGVTPIQYVNNNAWQVLAKSDATKSSLAKLSAPWLRYSGRMTADQKIATSLNAALAEGRDDIHAVVVLADHVAVDISKQAIEALVASHGEWYGLGEGQIALEFHADEQSIRNIAELGDVLTVGLHGERRKNDEVQTQIMAGHLVSNNTLPSGTGYLGWLTGLGFSTDPADYPIIAVADDGIGDGTTTNGAGDFRLRENGNGASRITYAVSCNDTNTAAHRAGVGGHGHLNSTIAVGYDQNSGWPYHDANGYLRGQGVNPFGRVANFEIFNDSGKTNCGSDDAGVVAAEAAQNAKISSNSWGYCANANCTAPLTTYDASARAYDLGVRDANGTAAGSPSMIVVFAAGNDGSGANTVGTPGTAKNVITVGASENVRPASDNSSGGSVTWTDGCGIGASGANSAMDVISFSSRGPSTGGRKKPEVIAPGTHVQGSRSPYSGFDGSGVCDSAMPPGQTSLAASSGTSHSTPAVAGAASLVYRYLQTQYGLSDPSPALVKGYFIAHPTYLTGTGANDTLPSNTQGYGMTNLDAAFDPDTPRLLEDQTTIFGGTGDSHQMLATVADTTKPLRIALVWTDAAGAANATNPQVNNLDLAVTVGGQTYKGNRFSGQWSTTGGSADAADNYEAVFLPAGTTGPITIDVTATAINGDGVPGNADATDQDFALVCSNCTKETSFNLSVSPTQAQVCAGASPQFAVDVGALNGFAGNVALDVNGAPAGATTGFSVNPIAAPGSSTLTVDTTGVAAGDYVFAVDGVNGSTTRSSNITLGVSTSAPTAFALADPANYSSNVATNAALSWSASTNATSYLVEVATDSAFGNLVWSDTVTATTATPSGLVSGTQYFWRVTAADACGMQAASQNFTFITQAKPDVLLVDDSYGVSTLASWTTPLDAILGAGNYSVWDVEALDGEPTADDLAGVKRVVWFSGGMALASQGGEIAGPSDASEAVLGSWLDGGACLFLSSQDYAWDQAGTTTFMTNYLGASVQTQDVSATTQTGQNVYNGLSANISQTGAGFALYPDRLSVLTGAQSAYQYSTQNGGRYDAVSKTVTTPHPYFTTWLAFPLEGATAANRQAVLQKFFDTCTYTSNTAPVAVDDAITVNQGGTATTLVGGATSVRANDTDAEDGTPTGNVTVFESPAHGSLTLNQDGTFSYVHDGSATASDSFTYVVLDSAGAISNEGTVSITITPMVDYTLTYTTDGNGTIDGTSQQTVDDGADGTAVTAVPNTGYHFVQWSDGSTDNPRTDTNVTADISVQAQFAINTYALDYTTDGNGTIEGSASQAGVAYGSDGAAVTAVPNTGYHFVQWSDGSADNPRTDTNVTADISVQAQFAINTYTLDYTTDGNGTIEGIASQAGVAYGSDGAAVTAVPNAGYHFVQWSDGSADNPRTDANVTADVTVTAGFAPNVLVFTTQPGDVTAGSALGTVVVAEQDGNGNTMASDSTSTVDLTLTTVCGTSLDLGTVTLTNGVATLDSDAVFYTVTGGLTINATSSLAPIAVATSDSFSIVANADIVFRDAFESCVP